MKPKTAADAPMPEWRQPLSLSPLRGVEAVLQRIAVVSDLVGKAPAGFGRTALMKCLYFLQTVRHVPLGYHFRLYTYGPFDSDVLSDLSLAERFGLVESKLSQFSGGYRYELHGGGAPTRIF